MKKRGWRANRKSRRERGLLSVKEDPQIAEKELVAIGAEGGEDGGRVLMRWTRD